MIIWSLNGARFSGSNAEEVPQTLQWLRGLNAPGAEVPDVLCLQDFRLSLTVHLRVLPYFHFVPMTNHWFHGRRELLGICIASRHPLKGIEVAQTWGSAEVRDLEGVDLQNARIEPAELSDRLVLGSHNRYVLACVVDSGEEQVCVATHHGFWTRDGEVTSNQMESTRKAAAFLSCQGRARGGLLFMADYNPDKYGKARDLYLASGARDCLPSNVRTTLASDHPAAQLGIRSDCVMTWPDSAGRQTLNVENVRLDDTPGSDHLLVRAEVHRSAIHADDAATRQMQNSMAMG